jgi:diguanylate cyclase (GGDEF)-like protein/PAS domain S-box-containing protein
MLTEKSASIPLVDERTVSLPKIVLGSLSCLMAGSLLSELAGHVLRNGSNTPLTMPVVDVIIPGALLLVFLYFLFRQILGEARERRDALHKALSISSNAVCICRAQDGTFLRINGAFSLLTGYDESCLLARKAQELDLWQSPHHFRALVRALATHGTVRDFEIGFVAKNGTLKSGLLTASMIQYAGEPCVLAISRDFSALKCAQERIDQLSYYDLDTGLPNRNLLMDRLNQLISHNIRDRRLTAVIYVGMNGFNGIVDALGHAGSNAVLQDLTRRLKDALRATDTIASLHRDELAILLGGDFRDDDTVLVIAKIEQVFARPIAIATGEIIVSANLGIACFPADGMSGEILLQHAHAAMNQAREQNDSFRYYCASMNSKAMERLNVESGMMRSIELGEFFLCYQPKYARNGRELTGMEALVRWRRKGEVVMPDQFIHVAEDNGMIVKLGEWVLREACRQNVDWQQAGLPAAQVSVNISPRQLRDGDFAEKVAGILKDTGLEPRYLELEITESAIMSISDDLVLRLLHLKKLGVSISIDDFGTGYSSLSYLKNLPIDKIKIDRSFVMDVVSDHDDAAIVDAIISMAHALKLCVIAEGVETKEQFDFLAGRNCSEFQGYFFSKPLSADHFAGLLRTSMRKIEGPQIAGDWATSRTRLQRPAAQPAARDLEPAAVKSVPQFSAEHMKDVARMVQPVSPQDVIVNVLSRFQLDRELKVLPVVEGEIIVGIVNRSTFFEEHIIGRQGFAAHINHAKKIRELMEPVKFIFDAATRIEDAAAILQPRIGTLRLDNIPITLDGAYAGMIDVNSIFKAMTEIQILLAKGANPLTGLPGNTSIERVICERLNAQVHFDIAYIDIDNFKPFNDYYGFQKGDESIKRLAEIMTAVVAASPFAATTFCGHIGGDDFILITESFQAEELSRQIAASFEEERVLFHGAKDYENGGYYALNRQGEYQGFPLISLSVGIVNTYLSPVGSYANLASLSTEVKKAAKKTPGTSIVVDGRTAAHQDAQQPLCVAFGNGRL